MQMIEVRCGSCGKLLTKTDGNTEIVCPRCRAMNRYDAKTRAVDFEERKKTRNTSSGTAFR